MNWAWAQELPPTPKLILMALADAANHANECWPGIPFVAEKCGVSPRTVQRVLRGFEATKLMSVSDRFTAAGRRTSNVYRLHIDGVSSPDKLSPSHSADNNHGDTLTGSRATIAVTVDGDRAVSPLEPQKESKQQPLQFPRQLSVAERQAIAEQLTLVSTENSQMMLDELADAMLTGSIKTNPLRWFRGLVAKQTAGEFVPTGGIKFAERRKQQHQQRPGDPGAETPPPTDRAVARAALREAKLLIRLPA
jgi:hypothetical protein